MCNDFRPSHYTKVLEGYMFLGNVAQVGAGDLWMPGRAGFIRAGEVACLGRRLVCEQSVYPLSNTLNPMLSSLALPSPY